MFRSDSLCRPRTDKRTSLRDSENQSFIPKKIHCPSYGVSRYPKLIFQPVFARQRVKVLQLPRHDPLPQHVRKLDIQRIVTERVEIALTWHDVNIAY
jgi:hypothetical protein